MYFVSIIICVWNCGHSVRQSSVAYGHSSHFYRNSPATTLLCLIKSSKRKDRWINCSVRRQYDDESNPPSGPTIRCTQRWWYDDGRVCGDHRSTFVFSSWTFIATDLSDWNAITHYINFIGKWMRCIFKTVALCSTIGSIDFAAHVRVCAVCGSDSS